MPLIRYWSLFSRERALEKHLELDVNVCTCMIRWFDSAFYKSCPSTRKFGALSAASIRVIWVPEERSHIIRFWRGCWLSRTYSCRSWGQLTRSIGNAWGLQNVRSWQPIKTLDELFIHKPCLENSRWLSSSSWLRWLSWRRLSLDRTSLVCRICSRDPTKRCTVNYPGLGLIHSNVEPC